MVQEFNNLRINNRIANIREVSSSSKINSQSTAINNMANAPNGTVLSGTITAKGTNSDVVFSTNQGSFILSNAQDLKQGDEVSLLITKKDNQFSGNVISINNRNNNINLNSNINLGARNSLPQQGAGSNQVQENVKISPLNNILQLNDVIETKLVNFSSNKVENFVRQMMPLLLPNITQDMKVNFMSLPKNELINYASKFTGLNQLLNMAEGANITMKLISLDTATSTTSNLLNQDLSQAISLDSKTGQLILPAELALSKLNLPGLNTPLGNMLLASNIQTPNNQLMQFLITNIGIIPNANDLLFRNHTKEFLSKIENNWPALEKLFAKVAGSGNVIHSKLLKNLPKPNPKMLLKFLNYSHLLRQDSLLKWLNLEHADLSEIGLDDGILEELLEDFAMLKKLYNQAPNKDNNNNSHWQLLYIPIQLENSLHYTKIYVRDNSDSGNIRFVIEFNSKILGEVQLDGLANFAEEDSKKLNSLFLIMRSTNSIPLQIQQDILEIYQNNVEISGLKGSMRFEHCDHFPINPSQELQNKQSYINNPPQLKI